MIRLARFVMLGVFALLSIRVVGACEPWAATLISKAEGLDVQTFGQARWQPAAMHQRICPGDRIQVQARSRARIQLYDQSTLTLEAGTTVTFPKPESSDSDTSQLNLLKGALYFFSRMRHNLNITTPFVNAGIKGTEFVLRVAPNETALWVLQGRVSLSNRYGELTLKNGEEAVTEAGKAPIRRLRVKPQDAVQWALYYPPLIDYRLPNDLEKADRAALQEAMNFYLANRLQPAFARLDTVPKAHRSQQFYTLRAGMLLTIGQVEQARSDLSQAQRLNPADGTAHALEAIIAMVNNQKDDALRLAEKSVALDPQSAVAHMALSYVHQAVFEIEKALDDTHKAVALSPQDALTWARLAELQLSLGDQDAALEAAAQAVRIDPKLERTQSVLGFANLTQIKIDQAKTRFEKAIELDPAAPLPRLGLGLAKIRQGQIDEGTREIEIAVSLDPRNALTRSYLGKAYYEQKRGGLSGGELAMAKTLDPKDPTPWFYDAIRKQTTNRPVEALHDLQKAIALNDNRAVYRSRLLLDEDLAARSAALGRIYNDLGFQQRGLVEGWKSVNAEPSDHSAHRLLADNYSVIPRHEIARVSELLQSQLLQPINIAPVQPSLTESNLLIIDASGPSALSFNEFNPLFTRNRVTLQTFGVFGSNETYGDQATLSGIWNNLSYSLGQFHHETDGFRNNNDVTQDIYNLFLQGNISQKISIQAELRHRNVQHGDLNFNFDLKNYNPTLRENSRVDTLRLGARYSPSSNSDWIISALYQDTEEEQETEFFNQSFNILDGRQGYVVESQYLLRWSKLKTIVGGGYYDIDGKNTTRGIVSTTRKSTKIDHVNAYLYTYISLMKNMTWILGLSFDSLNNSSVSDKNSNNRINWKIGGIFSLTNRTTFRFAAFKTLKRSLVADQTIEPTQVAGFNQFFDDSEGTEAKRFGVAVDHKLSERLFSGVEFSFRKLKIPLQGFDVDFVGNKEKSIRTYINWTPHSRVAVQLEYRLNTFDSDASGTTTDSPSTEANIVDLQLRYFLPSGFVGRIGASYTDQNVDFRPIISDLAELNSTVKDGDRFVLANMSIGYRLPKRKGIFTFGVDNLFDTAFSYQGLSFRTNDKLENLLDTPGLPERTFTAQALLAF